MNTETARRALDLVSAAMAREPKDRDEFLDAECADDPAVRDVPVDLVTSPVSYEGTVEGDGPFFLLDDTGQEALLAARGRLAGFEVEAAERAFTAGGKEFGAGSWIMRASPAYSLSNTSPSEWP